MTKKLEKWLDSHLKLGPLNHSWLKYKGNQNLMKGLWRGPVRRMEPAGESHTPTTASQAQTDCQNWNTRWMQITKIKGTGTGVIQKSKQPGCWWDSIIKHCVQRTSENHQPPQHMKHTRAAPKTHCLVVNRSLLKLLSTNILVWCCLDVN